MPGVANLMKPEPMMLRGDWRASGIEGRAVQSGANGSDARLSQMEVRWESHEEWQIHSHFAGAAAGGG